MTVLLVVIALLAGAVGLLTLTQATQGVGAIGAACLLAILARLAQSGDQHRETMRTLSTGLEVPSPAPQPSGRDGWLCPGCGFDNRAHNFDCTRCGAARPGAP